MWRKNFLFFQSENGTRAGATLYSIILTAKAIGLNPEQYLMTLLKRLKKTPESRWEELLPWNSPSWSPSRTTNTNRFDSRHFILPCYHPCRVRLGTYLLGQMRRNATRFLSALEPGMRLADLSRPPPSLASAVGDSVGAPTQQAHRRLTHPTCHPGSPPGPGAGKARHFSIAI